MGIEELSNKLQLAVDDRPQHGILYLLKARKSDGGHCHKAAKKTGKLNKETV